MIGACGKMVDTATSCEGMRSSLYFSGLTIFTDGQLCDESPVGMAMS